MFAEAFDDEVPLTSDANFNGIAMELDRTHPLPSGRERDIRDFEAAMLRAAKENFLISLVFNHFFSFTNEGSSSSLNADLQSIVDVKRGFTDGVQITQRALNAMRRSCFILTQERDANGKWKDKDELGSGFLVGPHLVMTNYHVIKSLLSQDGTPLQHGPKLACRFDYHHDQRAIVPKKTYRAQTKEPGWLVHAQESLPMGVAETKENLAAHLDYAIIRLQGRPGDQRGFYGFDEMPRVPLPNDPIEVWQFPQGQPISAMSGSCLPAPSRLGFNDPSLAPRIYHDVNTLPGSSGSLILGDDKTPVALHDAGFKSTSTGDERRNRGIPLRFVLDDAKSFVTEELRQVRQKTGWHPVRRTPILGRNLLQDHIFAALTGKAKIITVLTRRADDLTRVPRIGRSYTLDILESCVPEADNHIIALQASKIDPDAFLTAGRIVEAIMPDKIAELPNPSDETTVDADINGPLVNATITALKAAAGNKRIWLLIDDLDRHEIGTQWPSSNYLIALYRRMANEPRMRVVLTGLPKRLVGLSDASMSELTLEETLIEAPAKQECIDWLQAHLIDEMPPDEFAPRLSQLLESLSQADAKRRTGGTVGPHMVDQDYTQIEALNLLLNTHARKAFEDEH